MPGMPQTPRGGAFGESCAQSNGRCKTAKGIGELHAGGRYISATFNDDWTDTDGDGGGFSNFTGPLEEGTIAMAIAVGTA